MPPGVVPIGHFLEKTAILRGTGEGFCSRKGSLFQANSAKRRSPDQVLERVVHVVGVWRRKNAGMVKRTRKKRVTQKVNLEGELDFLDLLLKAIC